MKKLFSCLLSAAMIASLTGCQSSSESGKYTAGTYTGTGKGHSSDVKVTVEFTSDSIQNVTLDVSGETPQIGGAAAEDLIKSILEAQSADFDVVSGATETSNAVKAALEDAIAQASGKAAEKTPLKDGTYTETVTSFGVTGMMAGEVVIENNAIKSITITEEHDSETAMWFGVAEEKLIPRII